MGGKVSNTPLQIPYFLSLDAITVLCSILSFFVWKCQSFRISNSAPEMTIDQFIDAITIHRDRYTYIYLWRYNHLCIKTMAFWIRWANNVSINFSICFSTNLYTKIFVAFRHFQIYSIFLLCLSIYISIQISMGFLLFCIDKTFFLFIDINR